RRWWSSSGCARSRTWLARRGRWPIRRAVARAPKRRVPRVRRPPPPDATRNGFSYGNRVSSPFLRPPTGPLAGAPMAIRGSTYAICLSLAVTLGFSGTARAAKLKADVHGSYRILGSSQSDLDLGLRDTGKD